MSATKKFKNMADLYKRASYGEVRAQELCIETLQNLGCEHLISKGSGRPAWENSYNGLIAYITALVGEYEQSEDEAFKEVLAEVNNLI